MLVVVGDSNTIALSKSYSSICELDRTLLIQRFGDIRVSGIMRGYDPLQPFFSLTTGIELTGFPDVWRFEELTGSRIIEPGDRRIFGFCFGLHSLPLARDPSWQKYSIFESSDKQFISSAVFREIVIANNQYILNFFDALNQLKVRFFVLPPPPVRTAFIKKYSNSMSCDEHVAFQKTYWKLMEAELLLRSVPIMWVPSGIDSGGVLHERYESHHEHDDNHANEEYGNVFWRQFADKVRLTELF